MKRNLAYIIAITTVLMIAAVISGLGYPTDRVGDLEIGLAMGNLLTLTGLVLAHYFKRDKDSGEMESHDHEDAR
ncbi:hypothetical protein [Burkholderia sp. GbtcB21]|uniref:hypothetical protein n=1 Tax=Burkholderia sp. GbtcB21 TaxID=2824766 RepID=UPI001C305ED4|nr:hypothetical protein [Burkholderia sp. GbtcB21]